MTPSAALFAPRDPLSATLTDVRRGHSHPFMRYSFATVTV
jgi:hypothetical protein